MQQVRRDLPERWLLEDEKKRKRYLAFAEWSIQQANLKHLPFPRLADRFRTKRSVLEWACQHLTGPGLVLEFGVFRGKSINTAARLLPKRLIFGFDSFEGFPVDGRPDWQKSFRVEALPTVPQNVSLIKGWFD